MKVRKRSKQPEPDPMDGVRVTRGMRNPPARVRESTPSPPPALVQSGQDCCAFVRKLYTMVCNEPDHVLKWSADGKSFEVKDPVLLEASLGRYFRHSKFASLVRQLNFYAFKKTSKVRNSWTYAHPFFARDRPELLDQLRRRTQQPAAHDEGMMLAPVAPPPQAVKRTAESPRRPRPRKLPKKAPAPAEDPFDHSFQPDLLEMHLGSASKRAKMFALMQHLRGGPLSSPSSLEAQQRVPSPVTQLLVPDLSGSEYYPGTNELHSPRVLFGAVEQSVQPVVSPWGGLFYPTPSPAAAQAVTMFASGFEEDWETASEAATSPELGPQASLAVPMEPLSLPEVPEF